MKIASASRPVRTAYVLACIVATAACVKVTDDVKATFAPPAPGEVDNFAVGSPHGAASSKTELTQATVPKADASWTQTAAAPLGEGLCPRDVAVSSSADASTTLTSNCMQDAGIQ